MISFLLLITLMALIAGAKFAEVDPDWLVWILACVTAVITGALELARSRPGQALENRLTALETQQQLDGRITTLEAQAVPDLPNKIAELQANAIPNSEFQSLKHRVSMLEFVSKQASGDTNDE